MAFYAWDDDVPGLVVFGDRIRDGARELVSRLRARGITTTIVSVVGNLYRLTRPASNPSTPQPSV